MVLCTRVSISRDGSTERAISAGLTVRITLGILLLATSRAKVSIAGPMRESTRVYGLKTKCTDGAFLPGRTASGTRVSID